MKESNLRFKISTLILATLISLAGFYGCNDSSTNSAQTDNLSFGSMSSLDSIGDSQNILILDTVKILIKDIKLNVANNNGDSTNFKVGPFVIFLDMRPTFKAISTSLIMPGEYNKIIFEIHKLADIEEIPDPEFADAYGRYSVVVKGWYLGNYFVYKSTKSAHQILQFPKTIPISLSYYTNITLIVKPYIWFIKNGGWLNPLDPANSNDIDNNIKDNINHNFKAFKDNDKNGTPD